MKEVTIKSKIVGRGGASAATSPGKGVSVDMSGYLLRQIWEKAFEIRVTENGEEYLFGKLNFATQYGITMYADGGLLDLPKIFDGLRIDNDTIYWEEVKDDEGNVVDRVLKSRGVGEGGVTPTLLGDLTNVGAWANAVATEDRIMVQKKDSSSWVALELSKVGGLADFSNVGSNGDGNAFTSFALSEDKKTLTFTKGHTFALADEVTAELEKYVTLSGTQTITGEKNFAGGLKVNGQPIVYDARGFWRLDGDLLVTGGITMFANEGKYTPSTITQGVNVDGVTIINDGTKLMLNPNLELGGGVTDYNDLDNLPDLSVYALKASLSSYQEKITSTNKLAYSLISGTPTIPTNNNQLTNGAGFITSSSNITGNAATATSLKSYTAVQFDKSDNGGKPCYLLISDVTSWYSASQAGESGIVGVMYGYRGGNMSGTCVQKMIAMCAYNKNFYELKTDVTSNVIPRIVKYNNKYYVALYMTGSGRSHYFIGKTSNMLSSFIELQCDANGLYSGLTVLYDTETMAMDGVSVLYATTSGACSGNAATATTASKLLTVSKTAWGQTYWTSGGVPTDISGNMSSVGNILSSGTNTYELGSSSNKWKSVHANCLSFGNEVQARLTTKGWYRFAVGGDENDYGGSFIFFIRRSYNNVKTESFVISATVGYGRVVFNQLSGAVSGSLITKVRATNYADNVIYFDLYYEGSTNGHVVYINAVGDVTIQTPTSVSSAYSYTTEFTLGDGMVTGKALTCFDYKGLAFIRQNFGKNLLTNGDNYAGSTNYGFANYTYDESVTNGKTYRLTICGKLGEGTSHIYAYWDGGSSNNTYIGGLSSKEERVVTITAKITNKQKLVFFQFNSNNQSAQGSYSYIRWAYLEEAYKEGELSTTTDYNNWLTEYNKLDARSFLYKIQRIDVGDSSYWSADNGLNLIDANAYALTMKRTASSGGTFIKMMANNQTTQSWASGVNNAHQFSWWYQNGTSDTQKMYLDSSGNLLTTGGITMYSDLRKKTILNHVELSLKEVADAPLIEHYYNSDESKRTHVGSVAQYWAGLNDWFCKEDGEGFLTMEIQNAALASAISVARELTRYESKTDKQIKKLKKRIGELEEEIENLKKV